MAVVLAAVQPVEQLVVVPAAVQPVVQLAVHHVKLVADEHAVVEGLVAVVHPWLAEDQQPGQSLCNMCLASLQQ